MYHFADAGKTKPKQTQPVVSLPAVSKVEPSNLFQRLADNPGRFYIRLYRGPPPPSGTVHLILSNGHFLWQLLQWRQLDGLAGFTSSCIVSYTPAGQKVIHGLLSWGVHLVLQMAESRMVRCDGCSSRCSVTAVAVKVSLSNSRLPLSL